MHLRKALFEFGDRAGQRVARLGMGGGDDEVALVLRREVLTDPLEALDLLQDPLDGGKDDPARLGERAHTLAVAGENLHPSSSSSSMIALEAPGWDVYKAFAASVRLNF